MSPTLSAPVVFGRYELLAEIGRGGMGATYQARRRDGGPAAPLVLIKRILPEWAQDPGFVESFVQEARITALLDSPQLARVLDFGQVQGEYFLATEFIHGRTLEALLEAVGRRGQDALPLPIAALIAAEMLAGLHHAHTCRGPDGQPVQIVHRDISPDNVMLSFEGATKVVDFGVAKARLRGRKSTAAGLVKGKWLFFSPEQADAQRLDARSDLFAVGIVLYRMVCGQLPFQGELMSVVRKISAGDYPPPLTLRPDLPPPLVEALGRALQRKLEHRYQTAQLMERALRNWLANAAPQTSRETVRAFVHWAFADQLAAEGIEPKLSLGEAAQLEAWARAGRSNALGPTEPRPAQSAPTEAHARAAAAPTTRRARQALAAGLLVALGAGLSVLVSAALRASSTPPAAAAARLAALARAQRALDALAAVDAERAARFTSEVEALRARSGQLDPAGERAFAFDCERLTAVLAKARQEVVDRRAAGPAEPSVEVVRAVATPDPAPTPAPLPQPPPLPQPAPLARPVSRLRVPTFPSFDDPYAWTPLEPQVRDDRPGRDRTRRVLQTFSRARSALYNKDYGTAAAELQACLISYVHSADCHRLLGFALSQKGKDAEALVQYREFLRLAPDHPAAAELKDIVREGEKRLRR